MWYGQSACALNASGVFHALAGHHVIPLPIMKITSYRCRRILDGRIMLSSTTATAGVEHCVICADRVKVRDAKLVPKSV